MGSLQRIIFALALGIVAILTSANTALAATTISGVVFGNNGDTVKGAMVHVDIPPDIELPPVISGEQGKFSITVPESITIPSTSMQVGLSATFQRAENEQVTDGPHSVTIKPDQDNSFPLLLRLNVPGNSTSPSGSGGPLTEPSGTGTIKYRSPDLSPIFKSRQYETFGAYLADLVQVAMVLSVVAATLVVVYAGFDYLNSGGSPETTARAKEMIGGALFGLATVFLAAAFLVSLYSEEALTPPAEQSQQQTNSNQSNQTTGTQRTRQTQTTR